MNLPEDFIRETKQIMGEERFHRFMSAFEEDAPTSIRLNPLNYQLSTINHPEGFYLAGRPQFTFDPLFHAGCYYVQEAASMFVTHVLRSLSTINYQLSTILDLCAAPGGKSTALRTVLPPGSVLVSNEPVPSRAQILLENITKWGWPDCIVTNNYPRDFRKAKARFDLILCDVPCSGEGMFRKDPATISEWSLQNVEKCWRLQREIVADAWECLQPGGILIYSTCTFNTKENEENVRWIMDTYDAEILSIRLSFYPWHHAKRRPLLSRTKEKRRFFSCYEKKSPFWAECNLIRPSTFHIPPRTLLHRCLALSAWRGPCTPSRYPSWHRYPYLSRLSPRPCQKHRQSCQQPLPQGLAHQDHPSALRAR